MAALNAERRVRPLCSGAFLLGSFLEEDDMLDSLRRKLKGLCKRLMPCFCLTQLKS